jgi:hypothetical protein
MYRESATCYAHAIAVKVEKGIEIPYQELQYNEACAWALAGNADSAFHCLGAAVELGYTDAGTMVSDTTLASLKEDLRWPLMIGKVTAAASRKEQLKRIYDERTTFSGGSDETVFLPLHDNVKRLIQADSLPFISLNYQNFRLYFRGNAYAATHLSELKLLLTDAFAKVMVALDTTGYRSGINLILVDSREELKEVTGVAAFGGMALIGDNTLFLVFNGKRRLQAKHELYHLVSNDMWGKTGSRLLDEGGAVFTDNECYCKDPLYGISAWLKTQGRLLPFNALINNFDIEARKSDVIAYLESAAIFKYLYETYGIPKLKRLRTEGFGSFEAIYGFPAGRLEKEWNELISRVKIPRDIDWSRLLKEGCG